MPTPGKQAEQKRKRKAVDMSAVIDAPPGWSPPPPEEREVWPDASMDPSGGDMSKEMVKVRMEYQLPNYDLVEFAVVQLTFDRGSWKFVAVADSSHDDEVHVHYYGRKSDDRVGQPEHLMSVACIADVAKGYDLAYARIVENWAQNKRRWHDA